MTHPHLAALATLIDAFSVAQDPWCLVAGAATAIYTSDWTDVSDIDVIVSVADARRLIASSGFIDRTDGGNSTYRSAVYATRPGAVEIDVFCDFEINVGGAWTRVSPTPVAIETTVGTVFVPSIKEQLAITQMLGREKDKPRIGRLERLLATSP
jgi:hypothetical protein